MVGLDRKNDAHTFSDEKGDDDFHPVDPIDETLDADHGVTKAEMANLADPIGKMKPKAPTRDLLPKSALKRRPQHRPTLSIDSDFSFSSTDEHEDPSSPAPKIMVSN